MQSWKHVWENLFRKITGNKVSDHYVRIHIFKSLSKNSCSADVNNIKNTLAELLGNACNKCSGGSSTNNLFRPRIFYTLGTPIFRNTSESLLFIFFLNAMCQKRIYLFVSSFLRKIKFPLLISHMLRLGIFLIIPDVSRNFPSFFQNIKAAFERCSTKVIVQQNDFMNYSSFGPMVKSRKALHGNLPKIELHHRYLGKVQKNDIENYISMAPSWYCKTGVTSCKLRITSYELKT